MDLRSIGVGRYDIDLGSSWGRSEVRGMGLGGPSEVGLGFGMGFGLPASGSTPTARGRARAHLVPTIVEIKHIDFDIVEILEEETGAALEDATARMSQPFPVWPTPEPATVPFSVGNWASGKV